MKTLFSLFFLLLSWTGNATGIIKGKLLNTPLPKQIDFNEPIDGFTNIRYEHKAAPVKIDSTFSIQSFNTPGYIYINLPGKVMKLFVSPEDQVYFKAYYTTDAGSKQTGITSIQFEGSNALGHEKYIQLSEFLFQQTFLLRSNFSSKHHSVQQLFQQFQTDLAAFVSPFDSLLIQGRIGKDFHRIITTDLKSSFSYQVINLFGYFTNSRGQAFPGNDKYDDFRKVQKVNNDLFTEDRYDSLRLLAYGHFDPLNEDILYSLTGAGFIEYYYKDLYNGLLKPTVSYDSSFLILKPDRRYFGFMKGRVLQALWANALYWEVATEQDKEALKRRLDLFKRLFPNSSLLNHLQARYWESLGDVSFEGKADQNIQLLSNRIYSSIQDLARKNFMNQYVFVDLWASWCVPCIQEFKFKNELKAFLDEMNIPLLYISIDENFSIEKLKAYIQSKKLYGVHYLATEPFKSDLQAQFYDGGDIVIPRYLLMDKYGKIVVSSLPRPSDMQNLKKMIRERVKQGS